MHRSEGRAIAVLVFVASLALAGCASQRATRNGPTENSHDTTISTAAPISGEPTTASEGDDDASLHAWPDPKQDIWAKIRADFTLAGHTTRPSVREWTQYYATHQRHLDAALARARPFLWHVVQQIDRRNMPSELALLPIVESGYNPSARSYVGASGLWQFMPRTADHMGLTRDWWYDGRNDAIASTRAALDYLSLLNSRYDGDWPLALAAYNAGPGRVDAALERARTEGRDPNYWNLDLPLETREYVPKLLALRRIMQSPDRFDVDWPALSNAPRTRTVELPCQTELAVAARMLDMSENELRRLNPDMRRWASAPNDDMKLLVPATKASAFRRRLAKAEPDTLVERRTHTVRHGEVLGRIARAYGVRVAALRQANHLSSDRIRVGQTLQIPRSGALGRAPAPSEPTQRYVVQAGDTLWDIARRYHIRVAALRRRNAGAVSELRPGQTLTLPGAARPPEPSTYIVKGGDTLWSIAQTHDVAIADLRRWNRLEGDTALRPGRELAVDGPSPLPDYYEVENGDSLWSIAHRFSMQVTTLRSLNDISADSTLQPGQRLRLQPSASG